MPCFHPLTAWKPRDPNAWSGGKARLVFSRERGLPSTEVQIACGQCIGCRLDRARQWAVRCVHEASLHDENCFLTLTYNNENLPLDGSLNKRDIQLFFKRLRKRYEDKLIRYFQCGEYGDKTFRPHHHAIVFGFDFPDKSLFSRSGGVPLFVSPSLQELWPYGFCTIGSVSFDSACYVARYVTKKITGEKADVHYKGKLPEYTTMSRRPGIGRGFYEKYRKDLYNYDKCVVKNNLICKPPRYYDSIYDIEYPDEFGRIKARRKATALARPEIDQKRQEQLDTITRLKLKERCVRKFEKGD